MAYFNEIWIELWWFTSINATSRGQEGNHLYLITHLNDTIIDTFSVTAAVSDNYAHSLVLFLFFILSHKRNFQCKNSGRPNWIHKYQNTESTDQPT